MELRLASVNEALTGAASVAATVVMACYGEDVFADAAACNPAALSAINLAAYLVIVCVIAGMWLVKCVLVLLCKTKERDEVTQKIRMLALLFGLALALPITTAIPTWQHDCAVGAWTAPALWAWAATVWVSVARVLVYVVYRARSDK